MTGVQFVGYWSCLANPGPPTNACATASMLQCMVYVCMVEWRQTDRQTDRYSLELTRFRNFHTVPCDYISVFIQSNANYIKPEQHDYTLTHIHSIVFKNTFVNRCVFSGTPPQYAPPLQVDLWPFDIESGFRITCDVGYLCANFGLSRPLCSRLIGPMYATDRQTSDAHHGIITCASCAIDIARTCVLTFAACAVSVCR